MSISRRSFLGTGAAAAAGLALPKTASAETILTDVLDRSILAPPVKRFSTPPVVISADNGFISKNANGKTGIEVAYDMILKGADPLDAIVNGVSVVELDPNDQSVG